MGLFVFGGVPLLLVSYLICLHSSFHAKHHLDRDYAIIRIFVTGVPVGAHLNGIFHVMVPK